MNNEFVEMEFPESSIKTRKGSFGNELSYVETADYIRRLNMVFDYAWSFEVLDERIEGGFVIVKGKLTAGQDVVKEQFGTSQVTISKKTGEMTQVGDDFKSAASDALKKCCSLLGIGLHLYSDGESLPKITNEQLAKIKALRTEAGMSPNDVIDVVEHMFQTRNPMALTTVMADALIDNLSESTKPLDEEPAPSKPKPPKGKPIEDWKKAWFASIKGLFDTDDQRHAWYLRTKLPETTTDWKQPQYQKAFATLDDAYISKLAGIVGAQMDEFHDWAVDYFEFTPDIKTGDRAKIFQKALTTPEEMESLTAAWAMSHEADEELPGMEVE